jgi:hypothetical protein
MALQMREVVQRLVEVSVTFTLANPGAAYIANDVVLPAAGGLVALPDMARIDGGGGHIIGLMLSTNKKSITPRFRVHFFNASDPTLAADNAPWKDLYADASKRQGFYDLPAMTTAVDTTNSNMSRTFDTMGGNQGVYLPFVCAAGSRSLYIALEPLDGFTPDNGQSFTIKIKVLQS